eukprot:scaffold1810_cov60-Cyclotella_meneghiniana.AAC.11
MASNEDDSTAMSLDESSINLTISTAGAATPSNNNNHHQQDRSTHYNHPLAAANPLENYPLFDNHHVDASSSSGISMSIVDTPFTAAGSHTNDTASNTHNSNTDRGLSPRVSTGNKFGGLTLQQRLMSGRLNLTVDTNGQQHSDNGQNHHQRQQYDRGTPTASAAAAGIINTMDGLDEDSTAAMMHPWDIDEARHQLRQASLLCAKRGLKIASRWAAEQLIGLADNATNTAAATALPNHSLELGDSHDTTVMTDVEIYACALFDMGEYSRCVHALSASSHTTATTSTTSSNNNNAAFNNRIINNNNNNIQHHPPPHDNLSPLGIYTRAYALYLQGERQKTEELSELRDALQRTNVSNRYLHQLHAELKRFYVLDRLDSFGLYVYGVVLKELGKKSVVTANTADITTTNKVVGGGAASSENDTAHEVLIQSILKYPYNWSAWLDLAEICVEYPSLDVEVERLLNPLSNHWMYHFFCVHVFIENKANENAIAVIERLVNGQDNDDDVDGEEQHRNNTKNTNSGFFVQSAYLQSQLAMAYYDVRDYDSAHEHFVELSEREPYRLEHMDAFSNVLYVKDQKVALSHLAHRSMSVDKFRPETCIIVGNYYSSKGRHEKAVQYFQRALKLNRNYLSAWTLLGHEYIEMKNTAAAIEAYRRAVDISDREYRAWYGLGQTYEIMNMLLHALFYFRKAAALHPHDARMWCAIGGCLLGLDRRNDAEKSYERAVSLGDGEGIATRKLAELYREDGDEEKAAKCYLRHLELRYHSQLPGPYTGPSADSSPEALETVVRHVRVDEPEAEALLYLAYYYRDNLEYDVAIICATRLEDYPGPEKEQGKSLLRDIRSRMDQQAGGRRPGRPPRTPTVSSTAINDEDARLARANLSMDTSLANAESSFEFSP